MAKRFASGALGKMAISLRSSFWFLPLLIVLGSAGLSTGMVAIDHQLGGLEEHWPKVFAMDASGARDLMSTIAASMMTVAGVVFSITIVALAQASTQYTSRVLRNFMRDRRNQVVLGVFLGVFAYCIGVMRSIPGHGDVPFVPHLALSGGLVLVLVAVTFLAVFIHHLAAQIQSGAIAKGIADDTLATIETLFPEPLEGDDVTPDSQLPEGLRWHAVRAPQLGYIERVDPHALLDFAREHEVVVRMERNVGDFASPDRTIASIGAAQAPDADAMDDLSGLFAIDSYRSIEQDIAFGLRQLVDVALKALSPGINDTTTAITSLDYLSVILERLAGRRLEPRPLCDGGTLRVIPMGPDFERLLALGMDQILENAHGNTVVLLRMLQAIEQIRAGAHSPARQRMLDAKRDVIAEVAHHTASSSESRRRIEQQLAGANAPGDDASGA